MKNTKVDSTDYANTALTPLIKRCAMTRGTQADVLRRLNERLAKPITAMSVARWLNVDPVDRVEPTLGVGLLLLEVGRELEMVEPPKVVPSKRYLLRHSVHRKWFSDGMLTTAEYRTTPLMAEAERVKGSVILKAGYNDGMVGKWHVIETESTNSV